MDLRGHGMSFSDSEDDLRIGTLVSDCEAVLDAFFDGSRLHDCGLCDCEKTAEIFKLEEEKSREGKGEERLNEKREGIFVVGHSLGGSIAAHLIDSQTKEVKINSALSRNGEGERDRKRGRGRRRVRARKALIESEGCVSDCDVVADVKVAPPLVRLTEFRLLTR